MPSLAVNLSTYQQQSPPPFMGNSAINSGLKRVKRCTDLHSGINPKPKSGIHPAELILFTGHRTPKALDAMRCRVERRTCETRPKRGYILIPSKELPQSTCNKTERYKSKVNRTKPKKSQLKTNRKLPSLKGYVDCNGTRYKINTGANENLPVYNIIVKRMIEQLDICLDLWGRVYAVRIDLHQKHYRGDNKLMSRFICNFRKAMLKEYGFNEFGYQYAREVEASEAKAQHYHLVIFFNAKQINSSWNIKKLARLVWGKVKKGNTIPHWNTRKWGKADHYIKADDHQAKAEAVYHFSYLAKTRGKSYRDKQSNDFNTSRLTKRGGYQHESHRA